MKATAKSLHNTALYEELAALCSKESAPSVHQGKMFGCPALYVGRKMALCVYEDSIGMRVPEDVAMRAKASDRAVPFTPYGKKPMREWIAVGAPEDLCEFHDLFEAALHFADANNGVS